MYHETTESISIAGDVRPKLFPLSRRRHLGDDNKKKKKEPDNLDRLPSLQKKKEKENIFIKIRRRSRVGFVSVHRVRCWANVVPIGCCKLFSPRALVWVGFFFLLFIYSRESSSTASSSTLLTRRERKRENLATLEWTRPCKCTHVQYRRRGERGWIISERVVERRSVWWKGKWKRNWREKILCVWGENERERGGEEENEG